MNLITCDWLNENLNQKDLCIIDCTWHLPGTNRDGKSEFLNERIPGSIFFDLDEFSDQSSKYPHTLADKEWFSKKTGFRVLAERHGKHDFSSRDVEEELGGFIINFINIVYFYFMTILIIDKSVLNLSAVAIIAFVSLGKQEPP